MIANSLRTHEKKSSVIKHPIDQFNGQASFVIQQQNIESNSSFKLIKINDAEVLQSKQNEQVHRIEQIEQPKLKSLVVIDDEDDGPQIDHGSKQSLSPQKLSPNKIDMIPLTRNQNKKGSIIQQASEQINEVVKSNSDFAINNHIIFEHSKEFLMSPLPEGLCLNKFLVDRTGFNRFSTKFHFVRCGEIYLAAKKTSSKYIISVDYKNINKSDSSFIGQVSCKPKSVYTFWDNGTNIKKCKPGMTERQSLGTLKFAQDRKPTEPRVQHFEYKNSLFRNRIPRWNERTKAFSLNFYDRVKKPSVKNFQLGEQTIIMILGKEDSHEFNLDASNPLSPLQAFMIALANYDKKIEY